MFCFRTAVALATVVVLLIPLTGCDSNPFTPNDLTYAVTYTLTITGTESTVAVLTYRDATRIVTVENPTNGWAVQLSLYGGTTVGATAQGTVENGSIEIMMEAVQTSGDGRTISQDSCTAEGLAQSCNLTVPDYTLPN